MGSSAFKSTLEKVDGEPLLKPLTMKIGEKSIKLKETTTCIIGSKNCPAAFIYVFNPILKKSAKDSVFEYMYMPVIEGILRKQKVGFIKFENNEHKVFILNKSLCPVKTEEIFDGYNGKRILMARMSGIKADFFGTDADLLKDMEMGIFN